MGSFINYVTIKIYTLHSLPQCHTFCMKLFFICMKCHKVLTPLPKVGHNLRTRLILNFNIIFNNSKNFIEIRSSKIHPINLASIITFDIVEKFVLIFFTSCLSHSSPWTKKCLFVF